MTKNVGMDILRKRGYETMIPLTSGGQGNVYKTIKNKITYAAKVVHIKDDDEKRLEEDLQRELSIIRNTKHPNCVKVEDLFRSKSKVYIIMEFMPNKSIEDVLADRKTPFCEWKSKLLFSQVSNAIRYLHRNNIAHRDIKLDNILFDRHFNPKVCDFGFSKFVERDPKTGKPKKSLTFVGTPSFEPPELSMGKPYDAFKGDVWSLGVCLFVMLNYDYPFISSDPKFNENRMKRIYRLQPKIDQKLSSNAKDLIKKMLEPNGEQRLDIFQVCKHPWIPINFQSLEY